MVSTKARNEENTDTEYRRDLPTAFQGDFLEGMTTKLSHEGQMTRI